MLAPWGMGEWGSLFRRVWAALLLDMRVEMGEEFLGDGKL